MLWHNAQWRLKVDVTNVTAAYAGVNIAGPKSREVLAKICEGTDLSADAFPYTVNPSASDHDRAVVRGQPARWACHDPRPCPLPPDWSGGYSSIFAAQAGEAG